jgi:predicted transcriptional regulator
MMENMENFNPMEMCKNMISSVAKASEMAFYATPEIRSMFEEWLESIKNEIFEYISTEKEINPKEIANKFNISESAVNYFLNLLAATGKIKATFDANDSTNSGKSSQKQEQESTESG